MVSAITPVNTAQNSKNRFALPMIIGLSGLGAGAGYLSLKINGQENITNQRIQQQTELMQRTAEHELYKFQTQKLEELFYSDKYVNKDFSSELFSKARHDKLTAEDFLDKEDLEKFKQDCKNIETTAKKDFEAKINSAKQNLKKLRNKSILIGTGIGALIGLCYLAEKNINKRNDANTNHTLTAAGVSILGGAAGFGFNKLRIDKQTAKTLKTLACQAAEKQGALESNVGNKYIVDIINEYTTLENEIKGTIKQKELLGEDTEKEVNELKRIKTKIDTLFARAMNKEPVDEILGKEDIRKYKEDLFNTKKEYQLVENAEINAILEKAAKQKSKNIILGLGIGALTGLISSIIIFSQKNKDKINKHENISN